MSAPLSSLSPPLEPATPPVAWRFGRCVVHPQARELWRDGQPVEVQRLTLDLLLYCLAHPGRTLSKDELLAAVWGDVSLTDSVLARAAMKLRRAIGDDQQSPVWLRTVHGQGYLWSQAPDTEPSDRLPDVDATAPDALSQGFGAVESPAVPPPPWPAVALNEQALASLAQIRHAAQRGPVALALEQLQPLLQAYPGAPEVHLEAARLLRQSGAHGDAKAQAEQAWAALPEPPPPELAFKVRLQQSEIAHALGDLAQAEALLESACPWTEALGHAARAEWLIVRGTLTYFQGRPDEAIAQVESALRLLVGCSDVLLQVRARNLLARLLSWRGLVTRATEQLQRAQQWLSRVDAPDWQAKVLIRSAQLHCERRQWSPALTQVRQAAALFDMLGDAYNSWHACTTEAQVLLELGQLDEAEQQLQALLQRAQALKAKPGGVLPLPDIDLYVRKVLIDLTWQRGQHVQAMAQADALRPDVLHSAILTSLRPKLCLTEAGRHLSLGQHAQAQAAVQTGLAQADPLQRLRLQALLHLARDEPDEAQAALQTLWETGPPHAASCVDGAIDLAWMQMAQGEARDDLIAHVDDYGDEYLPALLIRARHLDAKGWRQEALIELQRAVRQHHQAALTWVRRCVAALEAGQTWPRPPGFLTQWVKD